MSMVQDVPMAGSVAKGGNEEGYRVQVINNVPLGKDEKVYLSRQITFDVVDPYDPHFTRVRDTAMLDLVIDVLPEPSHRRNGSAHPRTEQPATESSGTAKDPKFESGRQKPITPADENTVVDSPMKTILSSLVNSVSSLLRDDANEAAPLRLSLPASVPTGIGAAPLPEVEDALTLSLLGNPSTARLTWSTVYFAGELCNERVTRDIVQNHEVLVLKRGGCTFSQKMRNIAAFRPSRSALKLVIVVSYDDAPTPPETQPDNDSTDGTDRGSGSIPGAPLAAHRAEHSLIRPHLDESQVTASGIPRNQLISMVLVGGGDETYTLLRASTGVGIKRRYTMRSRGVPITNLYII